MIIRFKNKTPRLGANIFVAPTATIIGDTIVGDHSSVWFGACIRGDYAPVSIGKRCSIQDNAVVHVNHRSDGTLFPTRIADDCIVGHGAVVEGCEIGIGCLIGMNAVILPGARIGAGTIVAAGAVVLEGQNVPKYVLLGGVPATVKRQFDGPQDSLAWSAQEYVSLAQSYLNDCENLVENGDV